MAVKSDRIRQAHFADNRWYSANAEQLQADMQRFLADPPPAPGVDQLVGLVAPHAGYFFSGNVAGASFSGLIPGAFDTVVLLGPDHRGAAFGKTSTVRAKAWRTPLGDVPIAWEVLEALQSEIKLVLLPDDDEHSLEIELPFLQTTLQQFQLVPLMMGDQSPSTCRTLGNALVSALDSVQPGRTLFVASSDLSHYFNDSAARQLDETTLQFVLKMDADGLIDHVETGRSQGQPFACGAGPIATVIHAAKSLGATQAHLLKYATSADVHPDRSRVVGYAAVAFSKAQNP
jgi:AmmeMemoRadiSam system protein B